MGSFSSSCAVSNLPIQSGDKVLWIYAKPKYMNTTHDLSDAVWRYYERVNDYAAAKEKQDAFNKKYPDSITELRDFYPQKPDKDFEWGFGEYDDYGWVEDEELPDEYMNRKILVRKDVADKMSAFGKTLISREWSDKKPYLVDNYLYCFLIVCSLTRIHLFGHDLLGRQSPDVDEMNEQKVVRNIIHKEFLKVSNEIRKGDLEYKNWSFRVGLEYKIRRFISKLLKGK